MNSYKIGNIFFIFVFFIAKFFCSSNSNSIDKENALKNFIQDFTEKLANIHAQNVNHDTHQKEYSYYWITFLRESKDLPSIVKIEMPKDENNDIKNSFLHIYEAINPTTIKKNDFFNSYYKDINKFKENIENNIKKPVRWTMFLLSLEKTKEKQREIVDQISHDAYELIGFVNNKYDDFQVYHSIAYDMLISGLARENNHNNIENNNNRALTLRKFIFKISNEKNFSHSTSDQYVLGEYLNLIFNLVHEKYEKSIFIDQKNVSLEHYSQNCLQDIVINYRLYCGEIYDKNRKFGKRYIKENIKKVGEELISVSIGEAFLYKNSEANIILQIPKKIYYEDGFLEYLKTKNNTSNLYVFIKEFLINNNKVKKFDDVVMKIKNDEQSSKTLITILPEEAKKQKNEEKKN